MVGCAKTHTFLTRTVVSCIQFSKKAGNGRADGLRIANPWPSQVSKAKVSFLQTGLEPQHGPLKAQAGAHALQHLLL